MYMLYLLYVEFFMQPSLLEVAFRFALCLSICLCHDCSKLKMESRRKLIFGSLDTDDKHNPPWHF